MSEKSQTPLAFLLVDGLKASAEKHLMNISHAVQHGEMQSWDVKAAFPTLSYPNYATILSGNEPSVHGLLDNKLKLPMEHDHMFDKLAASGKVIAVVGFYWWRCLLGNGPWHLTTYTEEDTQDSWVYEQAQTIAMKINPDFLLVHSLGVDYSGHTWGGDSPDYGESARRVDSLISKFQEFWAHEFGGKILVGSDHGMRGDKGHGGNSPEETNIRYYFNGQIPNDCRPLTFQSDVRNFIENCLTII